MKEYPKGTRFLRNKNDGTIYVWNEILSRNAACEEITEAQAWPERFITENQKAQVAASSAPVNLSVDPVETSPPASTSPELSEDAGRNLPTEKPKAKPKPKRGRPAKKKG